MIRGITFASQRTFSADFAHFQNVLLGASGITKGCAITEVSGAITVSEGYFFISGREVAIVGSEEVTVPDRHGTDLFCTIVFEIDLSKTNTLTSFNQGYFKTLTSTEGYVDPVQQDLDAGGTKYQLPFATYKLTAIGVEEFVDVRPIMNVSEVWKKMEQYTKRLVNGQQITDLATGEVYTISIRNGVLFYAKGDGTEFDFSVLENTSSTFVKNDDGTLVTTYDDGRSEVFQKNPDGSLQTTYYYNGQPSMVQTVTKNSDGSIRTEYTEGGNE